MAKTDDTATPTPAALPTLSAIDADAVPAGLRDSVVTPAQTAYVASLREMLDSGKAASGGPFADIKAAATSIPKIKRLVKRVAPDYPGAGKAIRWTTGAVGDKFAWFARLGEPSKAGKKASTPTPDA